MAAIIGLLKNDGIYAFEIGDYAGKGSPTRRDFINIGTQDNGELYADSTGWYFSIQKHPYNPLYPKHPNSKIPKAEIAEMFII